MQTVSSWTLVAKNAIENFVPYIKEPRVLPCPALSENQKNKFEKLVYGFPDFCDKNQIIFSL
jgi:hypothetical protein